MDIRFITEQLLQDSDDYSLAYNAVHHLHDHFASITNISGVDHGTGTDIMLPSGKAISPAKAANCLLEFQRTAVFLRGINKAILQLRLAAPGKQLKILYVGCGPYATLLTPLLPLFTSREIRLTLLDINPVSLNAVRKLYEELEITDYVDQFILEDAARYSISENDDFDLVISEALLNALRKEPQVAIMRNLIPQLKPGAIFIPEEITVDVKLTSWKEELERMHQAGKMAKRIDLGRIFTISKTVLSGQEAIKIRVPVQAPGFERLELFTFIRVFEKECLDAFTCGLTLPFKLGRTEEYLGKDLVFRYVTGENPHFEFQAG